MIRRLQFPILLMLCLVLFSTGCARKRYYTFNLRQSYNLARLEKDWPGNPKKTLTSAQQEIYEKRGAPDMIRFWWNNSANFPREYDPRYMTPEQITATKVSWIYLQNTDEVIFDNSFSSHSVQISDKLAVVIGEGDPEDRRAVNDQQTGQPEEIWTYPSSGKEYFFHGDVLYKTRQVNDPMGSTFLKG